MIRRRARVWATMTGVDTTSGRLAITSFVLLTALLWHAHAGGAELDLSWIDSSPDETGFAVERSITATGVFTEIVRTAPGATTYMDTGLADDTTYCYRVRAFNAAGFSGYSNIACGTTPNLVALAVLKLGNGSGTVNSTPSGIACGPSCSGTFPSGTSVTLAAVAAAGSTFTGWTGGGCSGTGDCTVPLTAATTVSATFDASQTAALAVSKSGTGTGTVTSTPAGIACGPTCSASFAPGTSVTLSATAAAGSTFTGWTGGGCSGTGPCAISVTGPTAITAAFAAAQSVTVAVGKIGTGSGTVSSAPAGISCGAACSATFASGTSVTLSATPATGSGFTGWTGGGCSGTGPCAITPTSNTAVTAAFALQSFVLAITKTGVGVGTVSSAPAGVSCGATCWRTFPRGTVVTLTAVPAAGSTFTGWSGACSGAGSCIVSVTAYTIVTATFARQTFPLDVIAAGSGRGSIASAPAGISCGAQCSASYLGGTTVSLVATAAPGSRFTGWSGGGCSGSATCYVTMSAATSVTATFDLIPVTLTVSKTGTGRGTVISVPGGIDCGSTCSASFVPGAAVTLTAIADPGSVFSGWGGACAGTSACVVSPNAATSVTAVFDAAFVDDFERPDSTLLGQGWTEPSGTFFIRSGKLWNGTEKARQLAIRGSLALPTGHLTADFTSYDNNVGPLMGFAFGYLDPLNYHAAYRQVGGVSVLKIVRVVSGVERVLASASCVNPARGVSFRMALSFVADRAALTASGCSVTASGVSVTAGTVGLVVTGGGVSHSIDNFAAAP